MRLAIYRLKNFFFNFQKSPFLALSFLTFISLVFMFFENLNGRFTLSDFRVYYEAADRIINGLPLYRHMENAHYVFKYSPVSAMMYIPFTVLPFSIAKFIYWIFLTMAIAFGFSLILKIMQPDIFKHDTFRANRIILLLIPILALHFLRELHLGQVNHLLMVIYVVVLFFNLKSQKITSAFFLSLSIFIKPFGLIFFPYFLIKKDWKTLFYALIFLAILVFLPLLYTHSVDNMISEYGRWYRELLIELEKKQHLLADRNHTIFSFIARYTPAYYLIIAGFSSTIFKLIILALIAGLYFFLFTRPAKQNQVQIIDFAILTSTIPLMAFTSANSFIFTGIGVVVLLYYWKLLAQVQKSIAVLAIILIGGNFEEIIGPYLSVLIEDLSLISPGAILLIYIMTVLRLKLSNRKTLQST